MAKLRVKCMCGRMFWSRVLKVKSPTEGTLLVPTQKTCQRCRNMANIIKQRRNKPSPKLGKENKVTKIDITPEYIIQELVKAENKRKRQEQVAIQAKKQQVTRKKGKPHFDPEEYDVTEEEER